MEVSSITFPSFSYLQRDFSFKVSVFFMRCQAIDFQFLRALCRALHVNVFLVEGDLQLFVFCKLGALVAQLPCTGVF